MKNKDEDDFIKEVALEHGISEERAEFLLDYQLKMTASLTSTFKKPYHPIKKEFDELIKLCNYFDKMTFQEVSKYNPTFLKFRGTLKKTNTYMSIKGVSFLDNPVFCDPFYFSNYSMVFHELKMTLVELVHLFEWELKEKYSKHDLVVLINKMEIEEEEKNELHFIRKVRNSIIHNQGIWDNSSRMFKISDNEIDVIRGERVVEEDDPRNFSFYFILMKRIIEIYNGWYKSLSN